MNEANHTSANAAGEDEDLAISCPAADLARFSVLLTLFQGDVNRWFDQLGESVPVSNEDLADVLFLYRVKAACERNPRFLERAQRVASEVAGLMSEMDAQPVN